MLSIHTEIEITSRARGDNPRSLTKVSSLARLTRADRQLHEEGCSILYETLPFTFCRARTLFYWLAQIGPMKQHLKHVALNLQLANGSGRYALARLARATKLTMVDLQAKVRECGPGCATAEADLHPAGSPVAPQGKSLFECVRANLADANWRTCTEHCLAVWGLPWFHPGCPQNS